jgi:phosphopantothenoylcysteine decarboxylase/phosphopantothenate--cysteine ligase
MGYEIARQAARKKCTVTLISGPTHLKPLQGVRMIFIETVDELEKAVMREARSADILMMTAAVNDYVPVQVNKKKLRRAKGSLMLKLRRTHDIVARATRLSPKPVVVGFSLETDHLAAYTHSKLKRKNLDLIVGNQYSKRQNPFGENRPSVLIINRNGKSYRLPKKSKKEIAKRVLSEAIFQWRSRQVGRRQSAKLT